MGSEETEEQALIRAAARGSLAAWECLVRRHERSVYNFALRLTGDTTDARDVMQEVFLGAWRGLPRFRGDARFTSWLFRIARNKAYDLQRRRRLLSIHGPDDEEGSDYEHVPDETSPGPLEQALTEERSQQVLGMLHSLPLAQRMVVELKFFQALTFEEIAVIEGISSNTAKTRFYTALRRLRRDMELTDDGTTEMQ